MLVKGFDKEISRVVATKHEVIPDGHGEKGGSMLKEGGAIGVPKRPARHHAIAARRNPRTLRGVPGQIVDRTLVTTQGKKWRGYFSLDDMWEFLQGHSVACN